MNIEIAIKNACKELKKKDIRSALLDSELLLSKVIKKDRKFILLNPDKELNQNEQIDFNAGDTQGLAASASAATYGLNVNFNNYITYLKTIFRNIIFSEINIS